VLAGVIQVRIEVAQNLLITVQSQISVSASLSRVFSARVGAGEIEDFGTAGQPGITSGFVRQPPAT
jgi:hypothetical protein